MRGFGTGLAVLLAVAAGAVGGHFLAKSRLSGEMVSDRYALYNGPWETTLLYGSTEADPLLRARVATNGILALQQSEVIYFTTRTDGEGEPLASACTYRVTGGTFDARWWSLTLYDGADFFIPNSEDRSSYTGDSMVRTGPDGIWELMIAPERPETAANWLPSTGAQGLTLFLRLYDPGPEIRDHLTDVALPRIEKAGACR